MHCVLENGQEVQLVLNVFPTSLKCTLPDLLQFHEGVEVRSIADGRVWVLQARPITTLAFPFEETDDGFDTPVAQEDRGRRSQ